MDIAFVSRDSWPTRFVNREVTVSSEDDKVKCLMKTAQTLGTGGIREEGVRADWALYGSFSCLIKADNDARGKAPS